MVSPPTRAFVDPLPISPVKRPVAGLSPAPTIQPNNAGGEGRTRPHQAFAPPLNKFFPVFPPPKLFEVSQRAADVLVSPDLPVQNLWGFDGIVPGPTYHARYGEGMLVRNRNQLPADNGGFGIPQVSTHLHNLHTPSESDGFPGDYFPNPENPAIANATYYDHHYPNVLAGFSVAPTAPNGDINESLISEGCFIEKARIERSVIGIRSRIADGARIRHSLILGADLYESAHDLERQSRDIPPIGIGVETVIENAIVDKNARIGRGVRIMNEGGEKERDAANYHIRDGVVVIPKNAVIPDGTAI